MKIFRALFFTLLIVVFAAPALEAKKPKKSEGEAADAGAAAPAAGGNSASHEGIEAAKAGDWNKAIEAFKRAGDDANNRYNLAIAYRQRGLVETKQQNWDAAIADFNEALKLKTDDNVVRRFRAFAYMSKGDWPKALEDYDAVLKAKRTDTEALERRSFVEMQLKDTTSRSRIIRKRSNSNRRTSTHSSAAATSTSNSTRSTRGWPTAKRCCEFNRQTARLPIARNDSSPRRQRANRFRKRRPS